MPCLGPCLVGIALISTSPATTAAPGKVDPWIESHLDELVGLYQHLHSHPELSYREENTARRMQIELRKSGADVTPEVGGLGVVAVLRNGRGPTVLVRADMDALPVAEQTGLPFASKATAVDDEGKPVGVMHACGHDVHMANLVGTARWLADHKDRWAGTVVLIGQPAEERGGGAEAMLDDGLYSRFPRPDYALALHVAPDLETGKVGYRSGPTMAGSSSVEVTVRGRGGHGAMPHRTVDPIVLASALVLDLQTIVSRENDPVEPAVVTVGSFHGGTKHNVIPDEVRLQLSVRAFRPEVRSRLIDSIRRRALAMAQGHEAPQPEVKVVGGAAPTVNSPALVGRVVPSMVRALGEENVSEVPPAMISEDFGLFSEGGVPTFMFRLGTIAPARLAEARAGGLPLPDLHSPTYRPDAPDALRTGIRAMTAAVVGLLPPSSPHVRRPTPTAGGQK